MTMDSLPVELVTAIFERVVHSSPHYRDILHISHISTRLREIALSSPSLWTTVHITKDAPRSLSEASLHRSKACSIDVSVDTRSGAEQDIKMAVTDLAKHVRRWSSFKLDASTASEPLAQKIFGVLAVGFQQQPAAALTTLDVHAPEKTASLARWRDLGTPVAHRLESLTLNGTIIDLTSASFPLLRDLSLTNIAQAQCPSTSTFMSFLRSSPLLDSLRLVDVGFWGGLDMDSTPAVSLLLPNLSSFSIQGVTLGFIHHFLSSVDLPNLTHVTMGAHSAPDNLDWSVVPMHALFNVRDFNWNATADPQSEAHALRIGAAWESLLHRLPNATRVSVSSAAALTRMAAIAEDVTAAPTLPKMTHLEFVGVKGCGLDAVNGLVRARTREGLAKLSQLSISARDFSTVASVGQRALEALDTTMEELRRGVEKGGLEVRERQDGEAFRYTFLGWQDYQAHQTWGRSEEYDQEYEE